MVSLARGPGSIRTFPPYTQLQAGLQLPELVAQVFAVACAIEAMEVRRDGSLFSAVGHGCYHFGLEPVVGTAADIHVVTTTGSSWWALSTTMSWRWGLCSEKARLSQP